MALKSLNKEDSLGKMIAKKKCQQDNIKATQLLDPDTADKDLL